MHWEWSPRYSVGVEELDAQHRAIFDAMARLRGAVGAGRLADARELVAEVRRDSEAHFRAEEAFLAAAGYPGLVRQRVQHKMFLKRLAALADRGAEVSEREVESLESWLAGHILGLDQEYAAWLRENRPGGA